MVFENQHHFVC